MNHKACGGIQHAFFKALPGKLDIKRHSPSTLDFPGQFGAFQFSFSALVGCLLATILSILDSVGDYFACAKACSVPPPPRHAVNRGLTIEGLCTFLAGCVGCGHATTTYAGNIGAIGLTKVCREDINVRWQASR